MRLEKNLNLPFEHKKSDRTREQIEADMLEKLRTGRTKDFDREEASVYSEELEKSRTEQQAEGKGGLYGQRTN